MTPGVRCRSLKRSIGSTYRERNVAFAGLDVCQGDDPPVQRVLPGGKVGARANSTSGAESRRGWSVSITSSPRLMRSSERT